MKHLAASYFVVGMLAASVSTANGASLFGVDVDTDQLITIDTVTGVGTAIGPLGRTAVNGISFGTDGTLYGYDNGTGGGLLTIDTTTGAATSIGTGTEASAVNGLAYASNELLYGTSVSGTNNLFTFDPNTADETLIATLSPREIAGLAFRHDGALYGADIFNDQLVTIDTLTGLTTVIGGLGFNAVQGLAFDGSGNLYGVDTDTDQLLSINLTTGLATAIGSIGFGTVAGLAFEPSPIPLPAGVWLLLSAVAGLGFAGWHKKRVAE